MENKIVAKQNIMVQWKERITVTWPANFYIDMSNITADNVNDLITYKVEAFRILNAPY